MSLSLRNRLVTRTTMPLALTTTGSLRTAPSALRFIAPLLIALFFGIAANRAAAQHVIGNSRFEELAARVRVEKARIPQLPPGEKENARREFQEAFASFGTYLDASGPSIRASWEAFLDWKSLEAISKGPARLNDDTLDHLRREFRQNAPGMELAPFVRVRTSLDRLAAQALREEPAGADKLFETQSQLFLEALQAWSSKPNELSRQSLTESLDWLQRTQFAPQWVAEVTGPYRQPNLIISVSSRFMQSIAQEPVRDAQPVRDCILGTDIFANAQTTGTVSVSPGNCDTAGMFNLNLQALICSDSVGYNGPATIYSRGATTAQAWRSLYLTRNGLSTAPSQAHCTTNTVIDDIDTNLRMRMANRLVNRIAWKRAGKSQGEAEAIASDHAEERLSASFTQRTDEVIARANGEFREKFLTLLSRVDSDPEQLSFLSRSEALYIYTRLARPWHLAAPSAPPPAVLNDLVVRLHDSFVGNASENLIGGFTLTDEKLAALVQQYTGEVPEELRIKEDEDPWSITFASNHPVGIEVRGNTVRLIVRGKKFSRGERTIRNTVDISAVYRVERTPTGSRLTRQGEVSVDFPKVKTRLSTAQIAFRSFLKKKFDNLFKPEFAPKGIEPKGRLERIGRLQLADLAAENGWLVLGWNRAPAASFIGPLPQPVASR